MKPIHELGVRECRYALTNASPHLFCSETTGVTAEGKDEPYCATHKTLCHVGTGKPWQSLAEMLRLTEQTVRRGRPPDDVAIAVDEMVTGVRVEEPESAEELVG